MMMRFKAPNYYYYSFTCGKIGYRRGQTNKLVVCALIVILF